MTRHTVTPRAVTPLTVASQAIGRCFYCGVSVAEDTGQLISSVLRDYPKPGYFAFHTKCNHLAHKIETQTLVLYSDDSGTSFDTGKIADCEWSALQGPILYINKKWYVPDDFSNRSHQYRYRLIDKLDRSKKAPA